MFMWVGRRKRPDFPHHQGFRSEIMKDVLESVFTAILQFLVEEKYVNLEHYFVDGTKIEAMQNATLSYGKSHRQTEDEAARKSSTLVMI